MANVFYVVLPDSNDQNSFSEQAIIKKLAADEQENVLFFQLKESALQYCKIAPTPKYLYHSSEADAALCNDHPNLWADDSQEPSNPNAPRRQDPEKSNQFLAQFYEPIANYLNTDHPRYSLLASHETASGFLILEVEVDTNDLQGVRWMYEDRYYLLGERIPYDSSLRKEQEIITLSNQPFTVDPAHPNFYIGCRQGPKRYILSLRQAELYQTENPLPTIQFSFQYQKLTQLRHYVLDPTEDHLNNILTLISPKELPYFFKHLLTEKIDPEQLLKAKELLFSAYVPSHKAPSTQGEVKPAQPQQQPIQKLEEPNLQPQPHQKPSKPAISLGWKIAFIATLGLAVIAYLFIRHKNTKKHKKSVAHRTIEEPIRPIELPSASGSARKDPIPVEQPSVKKSPLKNKTPQQEIMQKEFDFTLVQQGMSRFWFREALFGYTQVIRDPAKKAQLYENIKNYRHHLQAKQTKPLSFNKQGELRKKIEFKDNNTIVVTGTYQQLHRLSLYANYGASQPPKALQRAGDAALKKALQVSWSESRSKNQEPEISWRRKQK